MQHKQFITAFIIRNRYRAIKSKIATLKEVYFFVCYRIANCFGNRYHTLVICHMAYYRTSTRTYRIISAAAQKPNPNPCCPGSVPLCTVGMCALPEIRNGGGCLGGLGAEPPAAGGQWGSGGEAPSCRRLGFVGKAPSRRRHGGLGAEPPALENFAFFCKNNFILELF